MKVNDWLKGQQERSQALQRIRAEAEAAQHARAERELHRRTTLRRRVRVTTLFVCIAAFLAGGYGLTRVNWRGLTNAAFTPIAARTGVALPGNAPAAVAVTQVAATDDRVVIDLLPVVLATNASDAPQPPEWFRPGSVDVAEAPLPQVALGPSLVTHVSTPGIKSAPTVHGNIMLVAGSFESHDLHALDAQTGRVLWTAYLSDNGPSAAAAFGDTAIVNTESCTLFALDTATGSERWSKYLGDPLASAPAVSSDTVYAGYPAAGYPVVALTGTPAGTRSTYQPTHVLAAFDRVTGGIRWQRWIDGEVVTAPVIDGDQVHVTTYAGTRYVFDALTGEPLQAYYDRATSAPRVAGDHIYYTALDDRDGLRGEAVLVASLGSDEPVTVLHQRAAPYLEPAALAGFMSTGDANDNNMAAWSYGMPNASSVLGFYSVPLMLVYEGSRVTLDNGRLYNTMGDRVLCLDAATGEVVWEHELKGDMSQSGWLAGPPTVERGRVYVGTRSRELLVLNSEDGSLIRSYLAAGPITSRPVVVDNRAYASCSNGDAMIVELLSDAPAP